MATAVRVSGELVKEAKIYSKIDKRSIGGRALSVEQAKDIRHDVCKRVTRASETDE